MEHETDQRQRSRARNYAYRILKVRMRSEKEFRVKLQENEFPQPIVDEVVRSFQDMGLIDDRSFTQKWIAFRLAKPWGIRRIQRELKDKGIAEATITTEIQAATADVSEEMIVKEIAQRRAEHFKHIEKQKLKQRIYGYLLRRGFSPESVMKAIKEL